MAKINVIQKLKFVFGRRYNIMGKAENAVYYNFSMFSKALFISFVKSCDLVEKGKLFSTKKKKICT